MNNYGSSVCHEGDLSSRKKTRQINWNDSEKVTKATILCGFQQIEAFSVVECRNTSE